MEDATVLDRAAGLGCSCAKPGRMKQPHRHDDIEIHSCEGSQVEYAFAGRRITLAPGVVSAFWASLPHQLLTHQPRMDQLTIPLSVLLRWRLPEPFVTGLLHGEVLVGPPGPMGSDGIQFQQWAADLDSGDASLRAIALLEIEGRVRRFARECSPANRTRRTPPNDRQLERTSIMASFVAAHFSEPLRVQDVTRAANLSVHYGMTIFKNTMGMSIVNYLANCRLTAAQRLLVTTDLPTTQVAFAAGFGSVPQFYARFTAACGQPPGAYRQDFRCETHD